MKYYEIRAEGEEELVFWPLFKEANSKLILFSRVATKMPTVTTRLNVYEFCKYLKECKEKGGITFMIRFTEDD